MEIGWNDYQTYVNNLSAAYGVYMTQREMPTLTNGIVEELAEVREAVYMAETLLDTSMISVEIGDCMAYVMILAARFGINGESVYDASLLDIEADTEEKTFINALKISGVFKRFFRGDYLRQKNDDFSLSALNTFYTVETFLHTLTQSLGWVMAYLRLVAYRHNLDMEAIKRANMAKGVQLAEKARK